MALEVNLPLGRGWWKRPRADEVAVPIINRFFETNPTNTKEGVGLIERPALIDFLDAGPGPGRRLFTQPGFSTGDLFHVSGDELWNHHMNDDRTVTSTQIVGTIAASTPDIAATKTLLWITDGVNLQYTDGAAALTTVSTPDDIPFISLDVFDQYVLCVQNDSDKFYWIQPGATTIDPLDFATAERFPDKVFQVRVVGDEFWLLGESSIEVWRATGDGDAPFQRIEGRVFNFGIVDGSSVRMQDTSVITIGSQGNAYSIGGSVSVISDPSVAEALQDAILFAKGG